MQKTPIYKRCLWLLVALMMLALPIVSLAAEDYMVVKGGSLNLRQEASTSSAVLGQYPTGTWMTILEKGTDWTKVTVNGIVGYVMSKYLSDGSSSNTMYVRTNTGIGLNLRSAPSTEASILTSFKPGTAVNVLLKGNGWHKVTVDTLTGYMSSKYLSTSASSGSGTSTTGYPKTGYVKNPGSKQVLLLRETASTDARVIGYYGNGVSVKLLGESGNFYKVTVDGKNGYMMKKYISLKAPATPVPPTPATPTVPFQAKLWTASGMNVNLRFLANNLSDANIISSYPVGTEVTVIKVEGDWCKVTVDGAEGYMSSKYIKAI